MNEGKYVLTVASGFKIDLCAKESKGSPEIIRRRRKVEAGSQPTPNSKARAQGGGGWSQKSRLRRGFTKSGCGYIQIKKNSVLSKGIEKWAQLKT